MRVWVLASGSAANTLVIESAGERLLVDCGLGPRTLAARLRAVGVARVEASGLCTRSGGAELWSYRGRDADGKYGTQLGFLGRRA